jgi:hypothetical protein
LEKLRWDWGLTLVERSLLGVIEWVVPFLIAFWMWPVDYAPLLGGVLALLLAVPISFVYFFIRITFFPSEVRRDSGSTRRAMSGRRNLNLFFRF